MKMYKQVDIDDEDSFEYPQEDLFSKEGLKEFLNEWNSHFGTTYKTIKEFNNGEELHRIVPSDMTFEEWQEEQELEAQDAISEDIEESLV